MRPFEMVRRDLKKSPRPKKATKVTKTPRDNKRKANALVSPNADHDLMPGSNINNKTAPKSVDEANKKSKTMKSVQQSVGDNGPFEPIYSPGTQPTYTILGSFNADGQSDCRTPISNIPSQPPIGATGSTSHNIYLNENATPYSRFNNATKNYLDTQVPVEIPPPSLIPNSLFSEQAANHHFAANNPFYLDYDGPPIVVNNMPTTIADVPPVPIISEHIDNSNTGQIIKNTQGQALFDG